MPLFKVWNGSRSVRKMVVASTIEELLNKGIVRYYVIIAFIRKQVLASENGIRKPIGG